VPKGNPTLPITYPLIPKANPLVPKGNPTLPIEYQTMSERYSSQQFATQFITFQCSAFYFDTVQRL
jgi:hypothetical protein